jgi:hypothetical protein
MQCQRDKEPKGKVELEELMVKVLGSCIYLFEFVLVNVIVGAAGLKSEKRFLCVWMAKYGMFQLTLVPTPLASSLSCSRAVSWQ